MANVTVYNMEGNEVGTMELNDAVFGVEINEHLVPVSYTHLTGSSRDCETKNRSEYKSDKDSFDQSNFGPFVP